MSRNTDENCWMIVKQIRDPLNGERYMNVLDNLVLLIVSQWDSYIFKKLHFMRDGPPRHTDLCYLSES
jgi:hypothetical protein